MAEFEVNVETHKKEEVMEDLKRFVKELQQEEDSVKAAHEEEYGSERNAHNA
ncbi:ARM repeat superfamily protein [Sesbania bispinosa]|nr:ARM repeat superfamily protein [Sesbania bispinosa]